MFTALIATRALREETARRLSAAMLLTADFPSGGFA